MHKFALFSDLHNNQAHWAYIMSNAKRFTGGIMIAGDFLDERDPQPMPEQRASAIERLVNIKLAPGAICAVVSGNHDIEQGYGQPQGDYYWLSNLAARHNHLAGHGLHQLKCGWILDAVDWMEESANWPVSAGPNTIMLSHVGPRCAATMTRHGLDFSSEYMSSMAQDGGSSIYACAHVHEPKRHLARVGRRKGSLVCNPCRARGKIPNYIELDLAENTAVFRSAEMPEERMAIYT